MNMADNEQDKTEQPTPYRLEEARKRGQVPKSTDLSGVLVLVVFCVAFTATASTLSHALAQSMRSILAMAGNAPETSSALLHWLQGTFSPLWQSLLPVVMALVIAAVLANLAQTGPLFSTEPLKPDFSRLNPAQGLKRIFSMRILWELFKLCLKMALLAAVAWTVASSIDRKIQAAAYAAPQNVARLLRSTFVQVSTWMLVVLGLIALFDLWFTRREYIRKLRMSRRDLKDEVKRREGDPEIRQKRKRLNAELLKQARSVRKVPEADIVLTNPTHLAIALKYRPRSMRSPVVLCKGADALAAQIRKVAANSAVPCLRSPELARAIFRECRIDHPVPSHLFDQLAPVYRWLMKRPGNRIFT